jgi:hypothetical protein
VRVALDIVQNLGRLRDAAVLGQLSVRQHLTKQLHQVGEHARRTRERSADFRWNDAPHVALLLTPSFENNGRVAGDIGMDEHGRNHNDGIGYPRSIFLHLR